MIDLPFGNVEIALKLSSLVYLYQSTLNKFQPWIRYIFLNV